MRAILQRVKEAKVVVDGICVGSIGVGLLVFLGVAKNDTEDDATYLSAKTIGLRIFPDDAGKMNRNVHEAGGGLLIISQFTLFADCRKGRRPSFDGAAPPDQAQALYNRFLEICRMGPVPVASGVFQADMKIHLVNDGPVTLILDSVERTKK